MPVSSCLETPTDTFELHLRLLGAVVVIAANAGGAWTPIGDVTTTMLWIHGQISTLPTMKVLLVIIFLDICSLRISALYMLISYSRQN